MSRSSIPVNACAFDYNTRHQHSEDHIAVLAANIKQHGLINPIVAFKEGAHYQVIAGKGRVMGCRLLGLHDIAAGIIDKPDDPHAASTFANILQAEMTPIELADEWIRLLDTGMTQTEAANKYNLKNAASVSQLVNARLTLDEKAQQILVASNKGSGFFYELSQFPPDMHVALSEEIANGLTLKALKAKRREMTAPAVKTSKVKVEFPTNDGYEGVITALQLLIKRAKKLQGDNVQFRVDNLYA